MIGRQAGFESKQVLQYLGTPHCSSHNTGRHRKERACSIHSPYNKCLNTVLQNLCKLDQIYTNVIGLLFASCFNEAAQGNKAWFSLEHSPEWGILRLRTNPIFPQVSRPLHRLTRWNSPAKTGYSKGSGTVKANGLSRKPYHFGEVCIDLIRFQVNSSSPFLNATCGTHHALCHLHSFL